MFENPDDDPRNMAHPGSEEARLLEAQSEPDQAGFLGRLIAGIRAWLSRPEDT